MEKTFRNLLEAQAYFHSEDVCRKHLEDSRWGGKPVCPYCGVDKAPYKLKNNRYRCSDKDCKSTFTATIGTIFENSKIPLQKWYLAIYLASAHKKGISSLQLSRDISVTQKTAWFLLHRIREMLDNKAPVMLQGIVEVDETYVGGKEKNKHQSKSARIKILNGRRSFPRTTGSDKTMVFGLLEREGKVVNYVVDNANGATLIPIIAKKVKKGSVMVTDQLSAYKAVVALGYGHESVNHHLHEYVKGRAHTATIDGYWSQLKRGIYGIYHNVSPKHLQRYCDEFSFRYNTRQQTDSERFNDSIKQCIDKRLTYKRLIKKP